jgi:DNA-binding GntR family transcriptional regulator
LFPFLFHLNHPAHRPKTLPDHGQIHRMVMDIAANPVLLSAWLSLLPRVERVRSLSNLDRDRWTGAVFEHSKMFAALVARDGALLRRLAMEHFLNGLPTIRRLYSEPQFTRSGGEGNARPRARRGRKARA